MLLSLVLKFHGISKKLILFRKWRHLTIHIFLFGIKNRTFNLSYFL